MRAVPLVILVSYLCSACFAYVPASTTAPGATGESVRIHLSTPQTVELEEVTAGNITLVEGEVAAVDGDGLVVSAWGLRSGSGAEYAGMGRSVRLPTAAIERVERKEFSWLQSGGLAVGAILAGVLFTVAQDGFSGGGKPGPPPGTGK